MSAKQPGKLRILLIAEAANSQWVSVPLVGWSIANALHQITETHIVTQIRNRQSFIDNGYREGIDFTAIDSEKFARPLRRLATFLTGGEGKGWTTSMAFAALSYYYFEKIVWKKFKSNIKNQEFDIVHRVTPLSQTVPSLLAKKCDRVGVPFILGPLNGGVPWPKGFEKERHGEGEWLSYFRGAYKLLPGYRSTLRYSKAILVASKITRSQLPIKYQDKCVYIPENAINPERFNKQVTATGTAPLRACFVGRLVPCKGLDLLIEAAAPLLQAKRMIIDIIGDGPVRTELNALIEKHAVQEQVNLLGWVEHSKVQEIMCNSSILTFPSIREFGGGVILEAMALGIVPVVVDYAGPGELVDEEVGIKVAIGSKEAIIRDYRVALEKIVNGEYDIKKLSVQCLTRINEKYTWAAKAHQFIDIYNWVLGVSGKKPAPFGE